MAVIFEDDLVAHLASRFGSRVVILYGSAANSRLTAKLDGAGSRRVKMKRKLFRMLN